jgi:hypothetical protein
MEGKILHKLDKKFVDNEQSYRRLKIEYINGETECKILAAQDQAVSTNTFENKVLKEEIDNK